MVGIGDRSEKIRTYNFPQNRVTDHRIGLTLHQLDQVMEGKLDPIVDALTTHYPDRKTQRAGRRAGSRLDSAMTIRDGPPPGHATSRRRRRSPSPRLTAEVLLVPRHRVATGRGFTRIPSRN